MPNVSYTQTLSSTTEDTPNKMNRNKMERNDNQPKWLERAKDNLKHGHLEHFTMDVQHLDIKDVLKDSCYYLSAGADITPIVAFKDFIYSYIFCDQDLYDSIPGIENRFNGILVKLKDRLIKQGFIEIQKFYCDKRFLGVNDIRYNDGYICNLKNAEMSFWLNDGKIYSLLYLNMDNSHAYHDLYIKSDIVPKALSEILSEGGSLFATEQRKFWEDKHEQNILPEFLLGHMYSISEIESYKLITEKVEYFGDYGPEYGSRNAMKIYQRIKNNENTIK
jgi:hypothetical protein